MEGLDMTFVMTDEEVQLVRRMVELIDAMPTGADELLDCDYEEYFRFTDKLQEHFK
jgi:hypothetical protein